MYYTGLDIGGTSIKAVLVENKKIIKSQIKELPKNLKTLLELVKEIVEDLTKDIKKSKIGGIGFALAGTLDLKRKKMLRSPNIKYLNNQPIKKLLEKKLKYPIKIENDVNCFLLGESKIGLAKNLKNVFYLAVGSGIGGALMVEGKIILGAHGSAGEVGHMIIDSKEYLDLEELASNKFIKRRLGMSSFEAIERIKLGDKKAIEIFKNLGKNLGIGIANVINIFDPEAIILSGGVVLAKKFILPGINWGIEKFVISPATKKTKILFSRFGRFGGALGATFLFGESVAK